MAILAVSTLLFAYANSLAVLFAARLMQGAADAITWGVGFALVADLYDAERCGRVMGLVMSGSNLGFMLGPSIGAALRDWRPAGAVRGGVTALAGRTRRVPLAAAAATHRGARAPAILSFVRTPAIALCAVVVIAASATFSMFEPVVSLHLSTSLGQSPSRVGLLFGVAALASTSLHPLYGRMADRYGGRRLMLIGLVAASAIMPVLARASSFGGVLTVFLVQAATLSMVVTPSLAYMADASASAGGISFGVAVRPLQLRVGLRTARRSGDRRRALRSHRLRAHDDAVADRAAHDRSLARDPREPAPAATPERDHEIRAT